MLRVYPSRVGVPLDLCLLLIRRASEEVTLLSSAMVENGVSGETVTASPVPAGLDVGARTPAQIAGAVVAEVLAVRSGASSRCETDRPGPPRARLNQPPPPT